MIRIPILLGVLTLAACSAPENRMPSPSAPPRQIAEDQCGASSYQHLVGQPRSAIPDQPPGASWRVACTTCPVTQDYSPNRMNIFFDDATGVIEQVKCG